MNPHNEQETMGADPYKHQDDSEWKRKQHRSDQEMLCRVFGMSPEAVYDATGRFRGHEDLLFRFLSSLRFLEQANERELTKDAVTLRVAVAIFTIEGVAPTDMQNQERLKTFLANYLRPEDKIRLLNAFSFSEANALGQSSRSLRHLMFDRLKKDNEFRNNYACPDPLDECPSCYCSVWLQNQENHVLDELIRELGGRLYAMRCSVVHDAGRVYFGVDLDKPQDAPLWSATILDVFTERRRMYTSYESRLRVSEIMDIFRRGLQNCFEGGPWILENGDE